MALASPTSPRQRVGSRWIPASASGTLAGRTRRIAIVAMARKLLIAPLPSAYAETRVVPAGAEIRAAVTM